MLIIIDKRMPEVAKKKLAAYGEILELETTGITYVSISGHPDIFFCQVGTDLVAAPNLPKEVFQTLDKNNIHYLKGELPVKDRYPNSARYNAVDSGKYLIHNYRYTDSVVSDLEGERDLVHVGQGYTRCNLVALKDDHFISSDKGIEKVLRNLGSEVHYVNPDGIVLPGQDHGFFGGACGVYENRFFLCGSLDNHIEGEEIRQYITGLGYELVELYDGELFDVGSILFLKNDS